MWGLLVLTNGQMNVPLTLYRIRLYIRLTDVLPFSKNYFCETKISEPADDIISPFVSGHIPIQTGKSILIDSLLSRYHGDHTTKAYRQLILNEANLRGGVGVGHIISSSYFVVSPCFCTILSTGATVATVPITRVTSDVFFFYSFFFLRWSSGFGV